VFGALSSSALRNGLVKTYEFGGPAGLQASKVLPLNSCLTALNRQRVLEIPNPRFLPLAEMPSGPVYF